MNSAVEHETLGLVCSLSTALCWAIAVILFKKSGDTMPPLALNAFKNVLALTLMMLTGLVVGFPRGSMTEGEALTLFISGTIGIGVADTLLFYGLNQIGASRQAIVDALYSPSVVLMSFFFLGEVLGVRDALGGLLILSAVLLAALPRGASKLPVDQRHMTRGLVASASAMVMMAVAIVMVKPILERNDVLLCTTIRLFGGTLMLAVFALPFAKHRRELLHAFVPVRSWRYAIPGAIMGSYISMPLWIGAFKWAPAGVAALLNQTSTIFIVLLAAVFLRERAGARVYAAVALACAGSLLVLL
jgi:drug/metabolite transporter (DMT)-like permease